MKTLFIKTGNDKDPNQTNNSKEAYLCSDVSGKLLLNKLFSGTAQDVNNWSGKFIPGTRNVPLDSWVRPPG